MVEIDLDRAKRLLSSARKLFDLGDYVGVAGLSYQAFESATISLLKIKNGGDRRSHFARRERAKELLISFGDRIDELWEIRNVDFYGNTRIGDEKRTISRDEAEDCLITVEEIMEKIEELI